MVQLPQQLIFEVRVAALKHLCLFYYDCEVLPELERVLELVDFDELFDEAQVLVLAEVLQVLFEEFAE